MTLLNESRAADISLKNAELMIETAQLYYDTAMDKLNSGVLTESESQSIFMEAEAAAKKSKNALIRAIEKVIDFIKSAIAKISKAFSDMKMKKDIEAIKKIQNDPEVKKVKVEIPDFKEHDKNIKEYEDTIKEAEKKAKSGKLTQSDIDKMNSAKEKCSGKKKVIIAGAAASAIALGGLVVASKRTLNEMKNELHDIQSKADDDLNNSKIRVLHRGDRFRDNTVGDNNTKHPDVFDDRGNCTRYISDDQKNLRSINSSNKYAIEIYKIRCTQLKAEREVLYGTAWRKCVTTLKQFFTRSEKTGSYDTFSSRKNQMDHDISDYEELIGTISRARSDQIKELLEIRKRDKKAYKDALASQERQKKREQNYSDAGEKKRKGEGGKQKRKGGYSSKEDRIWNENAQDD